MVDRRLLATLLAVQAACGGGASLDGLEEQPADPELGSKADAALGGSARIWKQAAALPRCGSWSVDEDFSSGRYNAHRYRTAAQAGSTLVVQLARQAGSWQPAILVATTAGDPVAAEETSSGRTGPVAAVTIAAAAGMDLYLYVTSAAVSDANGGARLPRDAEYTLSIAERCAPPPEGGLYAGLEQEGSSIPRAGLANATLRRSLGVSVEPYGQVVTFDGRSYVRGTVSSFGGPRDTGVTPSETGALTGERLRSLTGHYAAMRFDYSPNGPSWWKSARLLVVNPSTGAEVVVRPVDWGPNTSTGRLIDLSPEALEDLGLDTDDVALVAFAARGASLGPPR